MCNMRILEFQDPLCAQKDFRGWNAAHAEAKLTLSSEPKPPSTWT